MTADQPTPDRRPISKRLRYEVFRRDDHACRYCGAKAPDVALTIDHVVPVALGGSDEPSNLVTACTDCNAGKTSTTPDAPLVENVAADALRWSQAMEKAAEIDRKGKKKTTPIIRAVDKKWKCWWVVDSDPKEYLPRPSDWKQNVENFVAGGLNKDDLIEAIEITMGAKGVYNSNLWRYFCGVCWNKIRSRQEIARALIEAESDES